MGLDVISIHVFPSLNDILQGPFFLHNGGPICILNMRGTFFGNVNKQIHFLHIFPFPMIPITNKSPGCKGSIFTYCSNEQLIIMESIRCHEDIKVCVYLSLCLCLCLSKSRYVN